MNKKFSTLVASLLLASGVGAYADKVVSIAVDADVAATPTTTSYDDTKKSGGYEQGKSYLLNTDGDNYLYATPKGQLKFKEVSTFDALSDMDYVLWTLQEINVAPGAIAPSYVFVNKTTGAALAFSAEKAVKLADIANGSNVLGGEIASWLSAPSYKTPTASPVYVTIPGDSVVVLAKSGKNVLPVKMTHKQMLENNNEVIKITPKVFQDDAVFTLSPNQLNTMLGAAGEEATKDSYFQLSFNPTATVQGEDNLWAKDLQATSVQQFELTYGQNNDAVNQLQKGTTFDGSETAGAAVYASLYPTSSKSLTADKYADLVNKANEIGYKDDAAQWVALRNRDGQYLVVDTMFVDGTTQGANKRISFAFKSLYNAKTSERYRDPRSYLWKVTYNPVTNEVRLQSQAYWTKANDKRVDEQGHSVAANENPAFYLSNYATAALKSGSYWYATAGTNVQEKAYIIRAALGATSEVTLAEGTDAANYENLAKDKEAIFTIKLGNSAAYTPGYVASGAYLLKVTGSKNQKNIGKYWMANLKGGFEVMEQAVRQNFQHMPAAQWIVKTTGTTAGAPISIVNREFAANTKIDVPYSGTVYVGGANNEFFFMGGDTLQFIPVADAADKYQGYKYVANDTIAESLFTFNYLHDLGMNKPINTKSDKDSVVWVDKNDESTSFVLERVLDDNYGTNEGLTNVANLVRSVYYVKVNDATKLQNDNRYLAYDAQLKKYVVSDNKKDKFFLKENNEDGACYYAFIPASVESLIEFKDDSYKEIVARPTLVIDRDANKNMFVATAGKVVNPLTGLEEDGLVVKTFDKKADATSYVNGRSGLVVKKVASSPSGDEVAQMLTGKDASDKVAVGKFVVMVAASNSTYYANEKVSVDNNTLDLVNGVLSNNLSNEVATSAFAVTRDADPLYRRFNTTDESEEASDAADVLKFYRVNAAANEYLYEDANSKYSAGIGFNFLGMEGKGDSKNAAMYVDTAYVRNNTRMPQYLIVLEPTIVKGDTVLCDATTHAHATKEEALACPHTKITKGYVDGRYLVNLQDSVDVHKDDLNASKYQWNDRYTRLGFVEARHIDDTLVIKNSVYTGNTKPIKIGQAATWASKDSIFLGNNLHKNVVFSFRYIKSANKDFLIESETSKMVNGKEEYVKNADLEVAKIAPMKGGWVKIQNGVPVIANNIEYNENGLDAEIFNVEKTDEAPTANESVDVNEVSVVAVQGGVVVKGAAGKTVSISNILGQTLAETTLTSDNQTVAVAAGIVIVSVDGEEAVKVLVK